MNPTLHTAKHNVVGSMTVPRATISATNKNCDDRCPKTQAETNFPDVTPTQHSQSLGWIIPNEIPTCGQALI